MCDIMLDICEVWRETKHTAYKQHRCACCRTPILAGAEYWRHFSIFDHEITSEALCLSCWSDREDFTHAHGELTPTPGAFWQMLLGCIEEDGNESKWTTMRDNILARNRSQDMTAPTPTPLHCKVCAKPLRGQQRLYCGRPCKRRAYLAQRKLREAQELADRVGIGVFPVSTPEAMLLDGILEPSVDKSCDRISVTRTGDSISVTIPPGTTAAQVVAHPEIAPYIAPTALTPPSSKPLLRRCCAYIQLLAHTLYHIFDGWRTRK